MNDFKIINRRFFRFVTIIIFFSAYMFVASGCEPLRKKFTRQKKKGKEVSQEFVPVLNPIDYPAKVYTPDEKYRYHYSLWKVWVKDFIEAIDNKGNDKQQKYALDQMIVQLNEMQKWIVEGKQKELDTVIVEVSAVNKEFLRPALMRDYNSIKRTIELVAKKVRNNFNLEVIKDSYIKI